jgi:hypothetical protein
MSVPFLKKLDPGLKIKQPIITGVWGQSSSKAFSYHLTIMPKTLCLNSAVLSNFSIQPSKTNDSQMAT